MEETDQKNLRIDPNRKHTLAEVRLVMEDVQDEPPPPDVSSIEATEEQNWRESIYEIALEQVLADDAIQSRTKQIFLRTAVD